MFVFEIEVNINQTNVKNLFNKKTNLIKFVDPNIIWMSILCIAVHGFIIGLGGAVYWDDWAYYEAKPIDIINEFNQAGSFLTQGVMSTYKGRALGSIGDLACYSFHETKNIISGEGGALLVNNPKYAERAEIIREKGTDRSRFFRGQVDKYTWQDQGSSFLPGELIAAFLFAQMESAEKITDMRQSCWQFYHDGLAELEERNILRRPTLPDGCSHNAHMYFVILGAGIDRQTVLSDFKSNDISSVFHYVPLHSSPAGRRVSKSACEMTHTNDLSLRLIRLPLWVGLT